MEIYDLQYEQLQEYVLSGKKGKMSDDLVNFLELLEVCRSMYSKYESKQAIIRTLTSKVYGLSQYLAERVFTHALNFFYASNDIKKEAWRNLLTEKLENNAHLAWEMNDVEGYRRCIMSIAELQQLNMPDAVQLPKSVYDRRPVIYMVDPEFFGMPKSNTRELADFIDNLDVPEKQKQLIKRDARITEDAQYFIFEENENEEQDKG